MWWSDRPATGISARPRRRRAATAAAVALLLPGCGFSPLYGEGTPATALQGQIAVASIDGTPGFALHDRLTERLGEATAPRWRLVTTLDIESSGAALTKENITTRFDVTGTAAFTLVPAAGGPPVFTDSVRAVTSYSAPVSETSSAFASEVARQDAQDRVARVLADKIVLRLAVAAGQIEAAPVPPPGR